MAAAMIAVLSVFRFPDQNPWALPVATALFIVAAITDWLDGFLARRWDAVSVFGRIMDPTADKILVLGAFVMLASPAFTVESSDGSAALSVSGVAPWMVIVILSRELLVTAMRGTLESEGVDFSATMSGKLKMVAQSIGAPAIMLVLILARRDPGTGSDLPDPRLVSLPAWALHTAAGIAWAITLITAISAIPYITRARKALSTDA